MEFIEKKSIYLQIADYFCENILLKNWKVNEKIPSVREISILMEVNPNTVMRSFTELQELGIIYNKRGIGYFVAEDGFEKALNYKKQEFICKDIPVMFRSMKMLNISCNDMEKLYQETSIKIN